jgi:hypothetical protein
MPLTEDQQAQMDAQSVAQTVLLADQLAAQLAAQAAESAKQRRMEAIRMAQSLLVENRRLKTASDAVDLTASAVTAMAAEILTYVEG